MFDNVNQLLECVVMSVSIRSPQDNYYTIILNIYVQLGDDVDCIIQYDCVVLAGMTWYTDKSVPPIRDDVTISIVCRVRCDK